ncbi:GAF domain-containing protein [Motilibacter rhizosphaerae]|uniref:GAF domain-containing protein n=1 Tax=Motilibacter rhizosphaerae TaxID=598652 RepID=A0A4V2F4L8_9ACTN|nr:GAF domain-containing protein [Motilibacter rhizosphaerae]RZS89769.1 GAF domain-containing protein [Motilibacter rhizosphaerae]
MTTKVELAELRRLEAATAYDLGDAALRAELDALAAFTAAALEAPIALVTLVLDSSVVIAGSYGVKPDCAFAGPAGYPVDWSFCAFTVKARGAYVVSDTAASPVHAGNWLVEASSLASYAGAPVIDEAGEVLGAHCVHTHQPRVYRPEDIDLLRAGAARARRVLARHRR